MLCRLRLRSGRGRNGANFARVGGYTIGQVDLPPALEIVDMHHDFSRTWRNFDHFAQNDFIGADLPLFTASIAN